MTIPHSAQIQALSAQLAASLDPARDYPALAAQAARWDKESIMQQWILLFASI